jgi:aquaporin Z
MIKKVLSELLGTFLLVFFGVGAAIITQASPTNYQGIFITALIFGGVLTALASTLGNVSGGHFNPAVSVAMLLDGRISFGEFIMYVLAQFVGATCATFCLKIMISYSNTLGSNTLYDGDTFKTFVVEAVMTFLFVLTVVTATSEKYKSKNTPLIVGSTLGFLHLYGILFDGAGLNPARSFASMAVYSWTALVDYLPFLFGPIFGAILAWLVYFLVIKETSSELAKQKKEKKEKAEEEPPVQEQVEEVKEPVQDIPSEPVTVNEQPKLEYVDDIDELDEEIPMPFDEEPEEQEETKFEAFPVDDTIYEDEDGNQYYLYTDGKYRLIK